MHDQRKRTVVRGRTQHGSVMIVALILLVLLTFLGFESMSKSSIGLKVASNTTQKVASFQGAENVRITARGVAENMADTLGSAPPSNAWPSIDDQGHYNVAGSLDNKDPAPAVGTRAFWATVTNYAGTATSAYVIEYLGRNPLVPDVNRATGTTVNVHVFRITINSATGGGADTALQTVYVTNCGGTC